MADEANVQGAASKEGAASGEAKPQTPTLTPEQESLITKRIEERLKAETDTLSKKFQSAKDKEVAKVKREAEQARREVEETRNLLGVYSQQLGSLDPDAAAKVELASYKERDRLYQTRKQRDDSERMAKEAEEDWRESIKGHLTELGVDPDDKGLDWADDEQFNFSQRQRRVLASASKIHKEKRTVETRALKEELAREIAAQVRKDLGVDSVSTETPTGKKASKRPSIEELRATPATEALKKFQSGEWVER